MKNVPDAGSLLLSMPGEREGEGERDGREKKKVYSYLTVPCLAFLLLACTNNLTLTRHNAALGCIPYTYTYLPSPVYLPALFFYISSSSSILQDLELPTATTYRVPITSTTNPPTATLYLSHTTILVLAAEQQLFVASLHPFITKTKPKKKKKKK